jgi:hypothetical protein
MDRFATYLAAFDGTRSWAEIEPLFDDAFDPDCVFVTPEGEMNKVQWAERVKGMADKGATVSGFRITAEDGDVRYYDVTVTIDDEPMHLTSMGTVKDGRLVRTEPVDAAVYAKMLERGR